MLYNRSTLVLGWVYVSLWPQTSVWNLCFWLASWTTLWSSKILKKKSFFYYEKGSLLQNTTLFKLHISFNLTKHHNHQEKKKHKTLKSFKSSLCVTNYFCDRNHNLMSLSRENKNTHMKPFNIVVILPTVAYLLGGMRKGGQTRQWNGTVLAYSQENNILIN